MFRFILRPLRRRYGEEKNYYQTIYSLLGFVPDNIELYKLALIHRSASVLLPDGQSANNERLEFLGDAILESVVSDYLYIEFPDFTEGELTKIRSRIVSRTSMDEIARKMGFSECVVTNNNGFYSNKHLCGNALEATIGAMYLDRGYEFTNRYVIGNILSKYLDMGDMSSNDTDHKSRLIEWCQKSRRNIEFITQSAHDATLQKPRFVCTLRIDSMEFGHGDGQSKKEAEQMAAGITIALLNDETSEAFMDAIDEISEDLNSNKVTYESRQESNG